MNLTSTDKKEKKQPEIIEKEIEKEEPETVILERMEEIKLDEKKKIKK